MPIKKDKKKDKKKGKDKKKIVKQKQAQKQSQSVVVNVIKEKVRRRSRPKPKLEVPVRPTFIQSFQPQPQFNVPTIDQLARQGQAQDQLVAQGQSQGIRLGGREPVAKAEFYEPIQEARPIPFEDPLVLRPMPFTDELLRKTELQGQPVAKPAKPVKAKPAKPVKAKGKLRLEADKPVKEKPIEPFMEVRGVGAPRKYFTPEEVALAKKQASKKHRDKKKREAEEKAIREASNQIEAENIKEDEKVTANL